MVESEGGGEHQTSQGSESDESGSVIADGDEESGIEYTKADSYDETRRGARLLLRYDSATDTFVGTVENTTTATLENVRVEVHLSNGGRTRPHPTRFYSA